MKCHAGVEFESGKPCPKCNAKLGEVCWPGINADLLEVVQLRKENARLRAALILARQAIWNGGDTVVSIAEIDSVLSSQLSRTGE
jgi:hypothetical protein